jgi:D-apionolactonase
MILNAGPLSVNYHDGFLRRIRHGNHEILRMIYFALRDHNWATLPYRIENEQIKHDSNRFDITYECVNYFQTTDILRWKTTITGDEHGKIKFAIEGKVLNDFRKNRAGFCVLHPLTELLNNRCEITDETGKKTASKFPQFIDAGTPFQNITVFRWQFKDRWYNLTFAGDLFETEDQRNWGDASFKTYCTPISKPFPVQLNKGDSVKQQITFESEERLIKARSGSEVVLNVTNEIFKCPLIGIGASTEIENLSQHAIDLLRVLKLHHYRIEVHPLSEGWIQKLSNDCFNNAQLETSLEIALHLTENFEEELNTFNVVCKQNRIRPYSLLLLSRDKDATSEQMIRHVSKLRETFIGTLIGVGTNFNFTEINRNRFSMHNFDFIAHALHPQEHAFDDMSLMENSETSFHTTRSAKAIYGEHMQVHISPVTLRRRFNPYATNPNDRVKSNEEKADPRQSSQFAAAWTFAHYSAATQGGTERITYYQTVGNQGIVSADLSTYPVYDMIKNLCSLQGKQISHVTSTNLLAVQAIAIPQDELMIVANLENDFQNVIVKGQRTSLKPYEILMLPAKI